MPSWQTIVMLVAVLGVLGAALHYRGLAMNARIDSMNETLKKRHLQAKWRAEHASKEQLLADLIAAGVLQPSSSGGNTAAGDQDPAKRN